MKKTLMAIAAVLCCAMAMTVSLTSCTIDNGDNPVIKPDSNVPDPLLNWGCSIAEVEQHVHAKKWWKDGNAKLEFWEFPFHSWHKWYYVSETFTEQYLFETQDGQNLRYVYIACADNTVSGNPFVDLLQRQGFQDTGKTVQFYGETHEQYFSADGKTEALLGVDDDGWWVIYKPKATEPVAMADVVTLDAAPHSLYKLDTKELLPIYIAVNSAYKDDYGETQFYDLSTITDVQVSADMFDIDASHLADNGYIKLTPNPEKNETKDMLEDIEDYGANKWQTGVTVTLTNNRGEKLVKELQLVYLPKNEQKEVLNIKKSDLNENNELILDPAVIAQFGLTEWPNGGKGDYAIFDRGDLRKAQFTDDGKVLVQTWGDTTEPDEPYKLTLTFTRSLTGSPIPLLPDGEGLMVNFRYELELNISE